MKICILSDGYEASTSPMKAHDLPCDPTRWLDGHACDRVLLDKATAVRRVIGLSRRGYDAFINLCDGAWDEDRPGVEVAQALERLGLAYTGATPAFFEPSREADEAGVPLRGHRHARLRLRRRRGRTRSSLVSP